MFFEPNVIIILARDQNPASSKIAQFAKAFQIKIVLDNNIISLKSMTSYIQKRLGFELKRRRILAIEHGK